MGILSIMSFACGLALGTLRFLLNVIRLSIVYAIGILFLLLKGLFHVALLLVASFWIFARRISLIVLLVASHVYTTSISLIGQLCFVITKLLHGIFRIALSLLQQLRFVITKLLRGIFRIALSLLRQLRGLTVILKYMYRFMEATIFKTLSVGSDAVHVIFHPSSYRSLSLSQKAKIALLLVGMVVFISIVIRANLEQSTVLYTPTYSPGYCTSRSTHRTPKPESKRRKAPTDSRQPTPTPQSQQRRNSGMGILNIFKPDHYRSYLRAHSDNELVQQYHSKQNKVKLGGAKLAINAIGIVVAHHMPPLIPLTWRNRSVNSQKLDVIREEMRDREIQITGSAGGWVKAGVKAGGMAAAGDVLGHIF